MSDAQLAVDLAARTAGDAKQNMKAMMAVHLRLDHGYGIRRIGRRLKMTDKEVKEVCGEL